MSFEPEVADLGALRALSHPLRLAVLDELDRDGPLTATETAARTGASPSNCSFHLRVLARTGYVVEAPGAQGRRRPWQLVHRRTDLSVGDLPEQDRAPARALIQLVGDRFRDQLLGWFDHRDEFPSQWRDAARSTHLQAHLTVSELAELSDALAATAESFLQRSEGRPHHPDSVPVAITVTALPLRPPATPHTPQPDTDTNTEGTTT